MSEQSNATFFAPPLGLLTFAPPNSVSYEPVVNGKLEILPLSNITGVIPKQFHFRENGGTGALLPGRPLSQSAPVNVPANAGFFVMLNGVNWAFVHNDPPTALAERPLGQMYANAFLDSNRANLICNVRLTDSNSDDPIEIIVNVVVVVFT